MIHLPMLGDLIDYIKPALVEDPSDRPIYFITPLILIFFTFCVMGKQYIGRAIQCYLSAENKMGWEQFMEAYCFVKNTYWVPEGHSLNPSNPDYVWRKNQEISYYQWMPVMLALQALLFHLPFLFWKSASSHCALPLHTFLLRARDFCSGGEGERDLRLLGEYLERDLESHRNITTYRHRPWLLCLRFKLGSAASALYLTYKLLNITNVAAQFLLLNQFLGHGDVWGISTVQHILNGTEWQRTGIFPRITFCDATITDEFNGANIQKKTFQCVLMMNLFNEKMYLFLWFWLLAVLGLASLNLCFWLWYICARSATFSFLGRHLRLAKRLSREDIKNLTAEGKLGAFSDVFLTADGVLLLRFVGTHCGDIVAAKLTGYLWDSFEASDAANTVAASFRPPGPRRFSTILKPSDILELEDGSEKKDGSSEMTSDDGFVEETKYPMTSPPPDYSAAGNVFTNHI